MKNSSRKSYGIRYNTGVKQGAPPPCFTPDFTGDSELYKEFGSLNDVSIALSKHKFKDIAQMRLHDVNAPISMVQNVSDDVQFDNIVPKSMCVNELVGYMRQLERDWKSEKTKND